MAENDDSWLNDFPRKPLPADSPALGVEVRPLIELRRFTGSLEARVFRPYCCGEPVAPPRRCKVIGALFPVAPCGRASWEHLRYPSTFERASPQALAQWSRPRETYSRRSLTVTTSLDLAIMLPRPRYAANHLRLARIEVVGSGDPDGFATSVIAHNGRLVGRSRL